MGSNLTDHVWVFIKPGELRKFVHPTAPSENRRRVMKQEGYKLLRLSYELPEGWDAPDAVQSAAVTVG